MKDKVYLILLVALVTKLLSCHSPRSGDTPPLESIVAADMLIEPTGNAELDSLLQLAAVPGGMVTLTITADSADSPDTAILNSRPAYVVSVTDTGTGMTPEHIENLFRLDKPQTRRGTAGEEGSGLGLFVCKELLGKHGSVLRVESREEKGSRLWFTV